MGRCVQLDRAAGAQKPTLESAAPPGDRLINI
jgi:hypothetical protein